MAGTQQLFATAITMDHEATLLRQFRGALSTSEKLG